MSFTKQDALDYHSTGRKGKLEVIPSKPCATARDLSLAYTPGDLCVYVPALGVLVSGDLVSTGYHPNLEDANVAGWRAALERLHGIPYWTLVPGHGSAGGREAVEEQIAYFDAAERTVKEAAEFGFDPVAALKAAFPDRLLTVVLPDAVKALSAR